MLITSIQYLLPNTNVIEIHLLEEEFKIYLELTKHNYKGIFISQGTTFEQASWVKNRGKFLQKFNKALKEFTQKNDEQEWEKIITKALELK